LEFLDPGEARGLLEQAWAGGVVLDYVRVRSEEDLDDGKSLRRVVLFTARGLSVVRGLDPGPEIDPSSLPGKCISVDEFYGWRVDRKRRRLLMLGHHLVKEDPGRYQVPEANEFGVAPLRPPWVWSDDPDRPVDVERIVASGYGDAFLEPPYPITLPPRAAQDLFFAIDDTMLGHPDMKMDIWRFESGWDPDDAWSPYFEGNWWGTCMWTVRTAVDEVVVIGASATE
jgi:hypothetical protein